MLSYACIFRLNPVSRHPVATNHRFSYRLFSPTQHISHAFTHLLRCHPKQEQSALPKLNNVVDVARRRPQIVAIAYAYLLFPAVSVPRDSKAGHLPDHNHHRTTDYQASWPATACNNLLGASSGDAITGLSYPGTRRACARRCRTFQVSPHAPAAFLQPHQPTCLEYVVPSRARISGIFTTFNIVRVGRITAVPVSLSPNPISSSLRY